MKKIDDVFWFSDKVSSAEVVGSKAFNLIQIVKLRLPVPDGFVIPNYYFEKLLEENNVRKNFENLITNINSDNIEDVEEKASKLIKLCKFPNDFVKMVETNFMKLKKQYKSVSVRSSANCEDTAEASFAGQFESFLFVNNLKKLLESIKGCWSSVYKSSTMLYIIMKGIELRKIKMSVIVQGMVDTDKAGVMFTKNIWESSDDILIEAAKGIGKIVVSGIKTPDRYLVDKTELNVINREITKGILSNEEIRILSKYGILLEEHFGKPQDIEWGIKGKDVFLLQSRPITA